MVSKWLPSFLSNCNYQNLSSLSPQSSQPRFWRAFHKQLTFNIQVLLPSQPLVVIVVQSLSHVWLFANPWTAAHLAFLSFTISWSLLKLMPIESVMPSNHLILCCSLLLLSSIFPSIRVFSNESAVRIRCLSFHGEHGRRELQPVKQIQFYILPIQGTFVQYGSQYGTTKGAYSKVRTKGDKPALMLPPDTFFKPCSL